MAIFHTRHSWYLAIFLFCCAIALVNIVHFVLFRIIRRKDEAGTGRSLGLREHLGRPSRAIFVLTCVLMVLPFVPKLPHQWMHLIRHGVFLVLVGALGWFAIGCVYVVEAFILRKYDVSVPDNIRARQVHTQFQVFRRVAIAFILVITVGAVLWTFNDPRLWHYGSGLLASAGLASLLLAAAAKSTASNFLAGMQIALTEPIRVDDVVVVQGEWGRIEEITTTFVVIKIWDLRRLIVPLSWFIENAFANWTRESANILTTAFLYLDYVVPVKELRTQLEKVVKASGMWDGTAVGLQVTNLTEKSMEVRCLMSAKDSGTAFNLQCLVREEMMDWVREHYPTAFPTMRLAAEKKEDEGGVPGTLPAVLPQHESAPAK